MVNLIANGSFVGHADGWYTNDHRRTASYDAGSLLVASTLDSYSADYRPRGVPAVALGGLTTIDAVGSASSESVGADASFLLVFGDDPTLATTLDPGGTIAVVVGGGDWTAFGGRDIAVPEGATHVLVSLAGGTLGESGGEIRFKDLYVGAPGRDAPPYPAASLPLGNRLYNGDFEAGILDWFEAGYLVTLSHETADPITGAGSLKASSPGGDFGTAGASSSPNGVGHVVVPGETLPVAFTVRGEGDAFYAWIGYDDASTQYVIGGEAAEVVDGDRVVDTTVVVPATATRAHLNVGVDGTGPATFWLDDVSLGTPVADVPRPLLTSSAVLSALAARRGVGRGASRGGRL